MRDCLQDNLNSKSMKKEYVAIQHKHINDYQSIIESTFSLCSTDVLLICRGVICKFF